MKTTIGIVFSGGGVRTLAHVGLIKALEEEGIYPTHVSGTSAGAIVAALYAANYDSASILEFFKKTVLFKIAFYAAGQSGTLSTEEYSGIFKKYFKEDDFDALHKKLYVAATDVYNATNRIFYKGKLIPALLASAAYPMVFKPVSIEGRLYFDGGITNDFPVEPLSWQCETVIGIYVTPLTPMKKMDLDNHIRLFQRAYEISSLNNARNKFTQCDLVIQPDHLTNFGIFEVKHLEEIFHIGYLKAKSEMDRIKTLLEHNKKELSLS